MNRREFIRQGAAAALAAHCAPSGLRAAPPAPPATGLILEPGCPVTAASCVRTAAEELRLALTQRGVAVAQGRNLTEFAPGSFIIWAIGRQAPQVQGVAPLAAEAPEAFAVAHLVRSHCRLLIVSGSDGRGVAYGLLELADAVRFDPNPLLALQSLPARAEQPANRVRGVLRGFVSKTEDRGWFNDRDFWRRYFALLIAHRFNRFHLALGIGYDVPDAMKDTYFYFAYPFFLSVPGYHVSVVGLSPQERQQNLERLRFASDLAAARGLDFQLGLWSHAYRWSNSPDANYVIEGLNESSHAPYCRDALALLLKECPNISGLTLRVHGESGVPEGNDAFWHMLFTACAGAGRPIRIDLHAKGVSQATIDLATGSGLSVSVSPKFSAEHMGLPYHQGSIRDLEREPAKTAGGAFALSHGSLRFTRYSYGNLLRTDRRYEVFFRIRPGSQRVLLWSDPLFASAYSRAAGMAGMVGCEIFEPLSYKGRRGSGLPGGREGYSDPALRSAGGGFPKFSATYRVFGRQLYAPDPDADSSTRELAPLAGATSAKLLASSLSHASRILPLVTSAHLPSASYDRYWPEIYADMPIVEIQAAQGPYADTPEPKRFGTVSPLDPEFFYSVDGFVTAAIAGSLDGRYTPVQVAHRVQSFADTALSLLAGVDIDAQAKANPVLRRLAIDIRVQAGLGHFFSSKFRAAVLFGLFERTQQIDALRAAVADYAAATRSWREFAAIASGVYASDSTYGPQWYSRGSWSDRLPAMDRDLAAMTALLTPHTEAGPSPTGPSTDLFHAIMNLTHPPELLLQHVPPRKFRPGTPVPLSLTLTAPDGKSRWARLHHRIVHQGAAWAQVTMTSARGAWHAAIPGDSTGAGYPLQYYFTVGATGEVPALFPGLSPSLAQPPYYLISTPALS